VVDPGHAELEKLRNLLTETEAEMQSRTFGYWDKASCVWVTKSVEDLKGEGVERVNQLVAQNGILKGRSDGVDDWIRCHAGYGNRDGYVVLCLGGTRALSWNARMEQV
jgi:hypothetical protein